jgi:hypothetical protein
VGEVDHEASGGASAKRLRGDGAALEVMAVELEGGDLYVIHAMDLRERYRPQYEEAKRWRI